MSSKKKTNVLLIYNNKGGIGKSTLTINAGYIMSHIFHKKVLFIEWDGQNTLTSMSNIETYQKGKAEYGEDDFEALETSGSLAVRFENYGQVPAFDELQEAIKRPTFPKNKQSGMTWELVEEPFGFDIIPSVGQDLSVVELTFMSQEVSPNQPFILEDEGKKYNRMILQAIVNQIVEYLDYDYVLIDCPPSMGIMALNGLAATTDLIIPTIMDKSSADGIYTVLRNLAQVKRFIPEFNLMGIVLNRYRKTRKTDKIIEEEVKELGENLKIDIFKTRIPDTQLVTDCNSEVTLPAQEKGPFRESMIEFVREILEKKGDL